MIKSQQFVGSAALSEHIVDGHHFDRFRVFQCEQLCDAVTETAVSHVFFCCYHAACFLHRLQDSLSVKRFDGVYVDNLGVDAHLLEDRESLDSFPHEVSAGEDRHVGTFFNHLGFTDNERLVGWGEVCHFRAAEAEIYGSVVFSHCQCSCLGLVEVARYDDGHVRKHPHHSYILKSLVCGTVLTECHAGMRCAYLDVFVRVSHHLAYLVIDPCCGEVGECSGERDESSDAEAGGEAYHVSLGYADLEKPFGESLLEIAHLQ